VGTRHLIAALALLALCACEGPRPEVREVRALGDGSVDVLVENEGAGEGEARVLVQAGDYQARESVDLKPHQSLRVRVHLPPTEAAPRAEVRYPPD
jgi:hypothetical protein